MYRYTEADTTAAEERGYDDAELERFVNAPDRPARLAIPRPAGGMSVSETAAAHSKIGKGSGVWADPRAFAAAATADVRNNTVPFNPPRGQKARDPRVAAAAAAARAALGVGLYTF